MNALQAALRTNHTKIAKMLIEGGTPVNHNDLKGRSVLQDASERGLYEIVLCFWKEEHQLNIKMTEVKQP